MKVWKVGYVDRDTGKGGTTVRKEADIAALGRKGFTYYQVLSQEEACGDCASHDGAIYPLRLAREGENLPPLHPNCKCTVVGYGTDNPHDDPWKGEILLWLEIMYGSLSTGEKVRLLTEAYLLADFSPQYIERMLEATSHLTHIARRMSAFSATLQINITAEKLEAFGWATPTREEAERFTVALALAGVSLRESVVQFMAIAAHESYRGAKMDEDGDDAYWESKGYDRYTRGAGYIQLTGAANHRAFLDYMGDSFSGRDTTTYIAENYALEASVWYWGELIFANYYKGVNGFIETKMEEGCDPYLVFLKSSYYVNGFADGEHFNDDINAVLAGETTCQIDVEGNELIINDRRYRLPNRWDDREWCYEKANTIF